MIPKNQPWPSAFEEFNNSIKKCQLAFANERLDHAKTIQQRDELLAALKATIEEVGMIEPDYAVVDAAKATIAKVESVVVG